MPLPRRKGIITLWRALPALSIGVLLLAPLLLALEGTPLARVMPPLPLIAIYYWAIMHPRRLDWKVPLIGGIVYDALYGLPLGLSPLLWLFLRFMVAVGRRDIYEQGFVIMWAFFSMNFIIFLLSQWILLSLYHYSAYAFSYAMIQWALATLLYPAFHALLYDLERRFHRRYWFVLKTT